ncbi:hypothetical protein DEO72_LG9g1137 [Vigna unguiculata]|uniref:Uncharacterized protein n=1 Tax=Vigna unguiculata TaxID=3917 RepID=A0A4D6MXF8_VIGUN|nr:hypothetical protein DEO72_LG9g1137 [Vigna unguiculata]
MVCVVKECKPNDLGDMLITLKVFKYDISPPIEEVKASMPVMRLNYVVKQTMDANLKTNMQPNVN